MLAGAVGIENYAGWNFKELEEVLRNAKTLKRYSEESNGILIGPSMAPHFVIFLKIPAPWLFSPISLRRTSASGPNLAPRIASRPSTVTEHRAVVA